MNGKKRMKRLGLLLCSAVLLLVTACGNKRAENQDGAVSIKPQVLFSQDGVTVTVDRFKWFGDLLAVYGTADNGSDKDVQGIQGTVYFGGVGVHSFMDIDGGSLPSGTEGAECVLYVSLDRLSVLGVTREMIGGDLSLFLGVSYSDITDKTYDSCSLTLPEAKEKLPDLHTEGLRMFACSGKNGDYSLSCVGERKDEDGGLELYIGVVNNSDKPLTPTINFCAVNGTELNEKYQYISGIVYLAPGSKGIGVLNLSAEDCAACGIGCFDDIDTLCYTATGILPKFDSTSLMLEYREKDSLPTGEVVTTDRGNIQVDVTEVTESQVVLEVRADMNTLNNEELISDIESMTFVNGCGEKFNLKEIQSAIDGTDICYTGTMDVRNVGPELSLCFLVIGSDVWLLG